MFSKVRNATFGGREGFNVLAFCRLRRRCLSAVAFQIPGPFFRHGGGFLFGQPRITSAIDETKLSQIKNDVVKAVVAANDRGAVADDFPLEHLQLQLKRSPEQEQALESFMDALHDPSPQFHQFLSPQQFGALFGIAAADLDVVTGWLTGHGFQVNFIYLATCSSILAGLQAR